MKKLLSTFIGLLVTMYVNAQATDLVIDCQTPGWLSSMINYGDQQTVRNLKVTGYINDTDMTFIGTLIKQYKLDGMLDLSECNIVGGKLPNLKLSKTDSIKTYKTPHSVTDAVNCTKNLYVDTLYFNCNISSITQYMLDGDNTNIGHLFLGDNIRSIPSKGFYRENNHIRIGAIHSSKLDSIGTDAFYGCHLKDSLFLPKSVSYIGTSAFRNCSNIKYVNINELINLKYLGYFAFWDTSCNPDTVIFRNGLQHFSAVSFPYPSNYRCYVFEKKVDTLRVSSMGSSTAVIIIKEKQTPPILYSTDRVNSVAYNAWIEKSIFYVPKSTVDLYEKADYRWKQCRIIGYSNVEKISIVDNILVDKGEKRTMTVEIIPDDADDKNIEWISRNTNIVTIDNFGELTAHNSGQTYIYAISTATGIKDSCLVTVRQPVSGITVSPQTHKMSNIGESVTLEATVLPDNATNKGVTWRSSNENVSIVARGKVVATGYGTAVIYATTEDGGYMDFCTITVEDATAIRDFKCEEREACEVRDLMGNRVKTVRRGQMYIRNGRKFIGK